MSVKLHTLKIMVKTADKKNAGTDSEVELCYWVNDHPRTDIGPRGWNCEKLDQKWDDRERGRTDMYQIEFRKRNPGPFSDGGISYDDFDEAKRAFFSLHMKGDDQWALSEYFVLGAFTEEIDTGDAYTQIGDHGWLLMGSSAELITPKIGKVNLPSTLLSTDSSEGASTFHLDLNGPFTQSIADKFGLDPLSGNRFVRRAVRSAGSIMR